MKKRLLILASIVILIVIAFFAKSFFDKNFTQEVSTADPVDIVSDFYFPWLDAVQATSTDPYTLELHKNPLLSKELRARLDELKPTEENKLDPVLCQTEIPEKIALRVVFQNENEFQMLATARGENAPSNQAIITLNAKDGGWYINTITCSPGEFAPDREFTFEKTGFLLKDSIIPPFNPQYWHLVFEENNQKGHAAPLFFDNNSVCTSKDGVESTCDLSQLKETMEISVQGQMTERGVEVKKVKIVN